MSKARLLIFPLNPLLLPPSSHEVEAPCFHFLRPKHRGSSLSVLTLNPANQQTFLALSSNIFRFHLFHPPSPTAIAIAVFQPTQLSQWHVRKTETSQSLLNLISKVSPPARLFSNVPDTLHLRIFASAASSACTAYFPESCDLISHLIREFVQISVPLRGLSWAP